MFTPANIFKTHSEVKDVCGQILNHRWEISQRIASGAFGVVYYAKAVDSETYDFVVKQEKIKCSAHKRNLKTEYKLLRYVGSNTDKIAAAYYFEIKASYSYMVLDLKGPNLAELYRICGNHFSSQCLAHIMIQIISALQGVHMTGTIHRDIKPENIVVGKWPADSMNVYLVDFGLAKQFVKKDGDGKVTHIRIKNPEKIPRESITGTVRYASRNAHYGDQARRDDLEGFGYVIMYLFKGGWLPWMGVPAKTKQQKYEEILRRKIEVDLNSMFDNCHKEFKVFLKLVRGLDFTDKPDYDLYINIFKNLLKKQKWSLSSQDCVDWYRPHILKQPWPNFKSLVLVKT